jgi:hypothetical protein
MRLQKTPGNDKKDNCAGPELFLDDVLPITSEVTLLIDPEVSYLVKRSVAEFGDEGCPNRCGPQKRLYGLQYWPCNVM